MNSPIEPAAEEPPLLAELSDISAADNQPVTPQVDDAHVVAILAESPFPPAISQPQNIPVDRDRWFVEPPNGRRMGPFTWPELLGCVKAKMFFADDLGYGEVNSHRIYLRDLFPTIAVRDPGPPVEPLPTAMQQLVHNPVSTVIFGPQLRPYQRLFDAYYAANAQLVVTLAIFYLLTWSVGWIAIFMGFAPEQRDMPLVFHCMSGLFLALGLFNFTGALLEWELFFNWRKIRWWRSWFGDIAARQHLLTLAWIPMGIGLLVILLIVSMALS